MASNKGLATTALLLSLNLLFFTMVSSTYAPCPPAPKKGHKSPPKSPPSKPKTPPKSPPATPKPPPKSPPATPKPPPKSPPATPTSPPKSPATPTSPPKSPPAKPTCSVDTLKLGVCASLLNDLVHLVVGTPEKTPCCTVLGGLADLDAAVCLCTAIKANLLGINLNVPVSLSLLLNYCGKKAPSGFQCA